MKFCTFVGFVLLLCSVHVYQVRTETSEIDSGSFEAKMTSAVRVLKNIQHNSKKVI